MRPATDVSRAQWDVPVKPHSFRPRQNYSMFVSVHANHTQSTIVRSFSEVVWSQVFTRLRVLKERPTIQVGDGKVKAIYNACQ